MTARSQKKWVIRDFKRLVTSVIFLIKRAVVRRGLRLDKDETVEQFNVRVLMAAFLVVNRPGSCFESIGHLEKQVQHAAADLVTTLRHICSSIESSRAQPLTQHDWSSWRPFLKQLNVYLARFKDWKVPDEYKLTERIKHALLALYRAESHLRPDAQEYMSMKEEFRAQKAKLRAKLLQIAGAQVLESFDEALRQQGFTAVDAEPSEEAASSSSQGAGSSSRPAELPSSTNASGLSSLPGRMTNEQLAHELLLDPAFKLTERIKHALLALYRAESHLSPYAQEYMSMKEEFRAQKAKLRAKLLQIAGAQVLESFDEALRQQGFTAVDAEPSEEAASSSSQGAGSSSRPAELPSSTNASGLSSLPGRMTNEQLAHELLLDPTFKLDEHEPLLDPAFKLTEPMKEEFRAQKAKLRAKLLQIAGAQVLESFDEALRQQGFTAVDAEPSEEAASSSSQGAGSSSRPAELPSSTNASGLSSLPGRMTNEQLAPNIPRMSFNLDQPTGKRRYRALVTNVDSASSRVKSCIAKAKAHRESTIQFKNVITQVLDMSIVKVALKELEKQKITLSSFFMEKAVVEIKSKVDTTHITPATPQNKATTGSQTGSIPKNQRTIENCPIDDDREERVKAATSSFEAELSAAEKELIASCLSPSQPSAYSREMLERLLEVPAMVLEKSYGPMEERWLRLVSADGSKAESDVPQSPFVRNVYERVVRNARRVRKVISLNRKVHYDRYNQMILAGSQQVLSDCQVTSYDN
ncbi:hypothetical protein GUITHDRAFT_102886 [Guillardia theta CCMP2712]|uniref:Uncharacterized protein n=1 Tax=Guillardia theta (strain CCMP2712) TaxID=905079 RepID=L1JTU5_GUITC|nr:hypothetical protein GUITHDRAFT_102886 [Guillardia theta CCMP2712]EKX51625.1 hypothetical protein GUITHDRAFT_102886 [Guillardia theta CCMP2712]|eukprot:XP_005838605.1 hypothetical protein GUITHDRAFT_102886 [Guillardia theta CCMP2712]